MTKTKTIDTLVEDIYGVLDGRTPEEYVGDTSDELARRFAEILFRRLDDELKPTKKPRLWFSNVGDRCSRRIWYKLNRPDAAEPFRPNTKLKFMYGDLLEELLLHLAERAGHLVQFRQAKVEWAGVTGRIDAIIDGMLVDVKSASKYSFKKFKDGGLQPEEDAFGYLGQLCGYLAGVRDSEELRTRITELNKAAFLVINKETGQIHLDVQSFREEEIKALEYHVQHLQAITKDNNLLPSRGYMPEEDGKGGNLKLGINCSYCEFKWECWENLRVFYYANNSPRFLTSVAKLPKVPEITREELDNNED